MIDNILSSFNDDAAQSEFGADTQTYKFQAIIGYIIPILFFLPYVSNQSSAFCRFHSNQQLAWFVVTIIITAVRKIVGIVPLIGGLVGWALGVAELLVIVLLVIGAVKGMAVKIPFLGDMIKAF